MIRYEVMVMPSASLDIAGIIRYISNDLSNRKAAEDLYDLCLETLKSLEYMSNRNPISSIEELEVRNIRAAPIGSYSILYSTFDDDHIVEVYRVVYSKSDFSKKF